MKRIAVSIVFNAKHHLENQYDFIASNFDHWYIIEGAAKNTFCTSWCNEMPEEYHKNGNSIDGTVEFIEADPRPNVTFIKANGLWNGKVQMFNLALGFIKEPCYLWEIDIDEYWEKEQLANAEHILEATKVDFLTFACDYLLSDQIIVRGNWGEASRDGYRRLWKFTPGKEFIAHEPPVLQDAKRYLSPIYTPRFTHLSYYYEKDVLFKSKWYGDHENVYTGWKGIITKQVPLPCPIEAFFGKTVNDAWKGTIITYR